MLGTRCGRVVHCSGIHRSESPASTAQDAHLLAHPRRVQRSSRQRLQLQRGECAGLGQPDGRGSGPGRPEDQSQGGNPYSHIAAAGYEGSHDAQSFERALQRGVISAIATIQRYFIRTARLGSRALSIFSFYRT